MSELKQYCEDMYGEPMEVEFGHFYLKSEADKVIAELKAQKAQAEDDCAYWKTMSRKCADDNEVMAKQRAEAFKRERHQKYKRCLGIAAVCFEKSYSTTLVKYDKKSGLLRNFYDWWGNLWLELAEKFKEAK